MCKAADVMAFLLYEFVFIFIFNFSWLYVPLSKCPLLVKIMAVTFEKSDFHLIDSSLNDSLVITFKIIGPSALTYGHVLVLYAKNKNE